jgi:hypothetical protein
MRQSQLLFSNSIPSPRRSDITSILVVHIISLPLVPLIPPFQSSPPVNLNSIPVFKCQLYLGRCPCCTSRSPILPHLMMVAPPGPASIDRVSFSPSPPFPMCWCHLLPQIPESTIIFSMPSAPFAWLFLFSSSDSQSLAQDPNISSLDEN